MDAVLIAFALLPTRLLSMVRIATFARYPQAVREHVSGSAPLRLGVSWLTWVVATLYVGLRAVDDSVKDGLGILAGAAIGCGTLVVAMYYTVTVPENRRPGVNQEHLFLAVPLLTQVLRCSALNTLLVLGIVADIALVALKVCSEH